MKSVEIEITGISPLLMHAFPLTPIEAVEKKTPEEQAEISAYRIPSNGRAPGELYIPGVAVQRALVNGATYSKGKGRGSLQKSAAACLTVTPEYLGLGVTAYSLDSRPVVMPATKGRIIRHRPRLDQWRVQLTLEYDETLLTAVQLRRVVDDTGSRVGLLDFRPERRGPMGRFVVTAWKAATT